MVNAFLATLAGSLATGGSETEVFLSNITTLTGETITTANFSTWGRGILTIDPLSAANIEFDSFTAIDASGIGCTGLTRGLSSLGNSVVTVNKKYHPVGTQVIIAFGIHNVLDMKAYIDNAVIGANGTASDTTAGTTKITVGMGSAPRARSAWASQQASPNMTLLINSFAWASGGFIINYAGGNTPTMTAPAANPRYDLVVYSTLSSTVVTRTGVEAASPSLPTPVNGDIIICSIYHRVGETTILERDTSPNTQGYISAWYEPDLYTSSAFVSPDSVTNGGVDQSQTAANGIQAVGKANLTGQPSVIAQKFVPTIPSMSGVTLLKLADTGTFTGSVKISVQADSSGNASGSDLASYTISNAAWLLLNTVTTSLGSSSISANKITITSSTDFYTGQPVTLTAVTGITGLAVNTLYYLVVGSSTTVGFATTLANALAGTLITISGTPNTCFINNYPLVSVQFGTEYETMTDLGSYWIVVTPSTSDSSNHPNLGLNTAGGYASGVLKYNNSADGWVVVATSILYFQTLQGIVSKVQQTSTNGLIPVVNSRYNLILSDANTLALTGTTAETTAVSLQLPGNYFTANGGMKIKIGYSFSGRTSNNDVATIKVKYNGTALYTFSQSPGNGSSATPSANFLIDLTIQNTGLLTSQIVNSLTWGVGQSGSSTTSIGALFNSMLGAIAATAVDFTQPGVLSITFANTNSSDTTDYVYSTIEKFA